MHHFVRSWDGGLAVVPSSQAATHDVQVAWGSPKMERIRPPAKGDVFGIKKPLKMYTTWKVDGDRHSQVRWRKVRGHDKPIYQCFKIIHGSGDRHLLSSWYSYEHWRFSQQAYF